MGAVGGTIVIAACVVFFLFLRRKKNQSFVNQSPDFNDDTERGEASGNGGFGFKKLFGSKMTNSQLAGAGGLASYNDIENGGVRKVEVDGESNTSDDFEYRGVTNSNNLDSMFNKTSATNTSGNNTNSATARHSRYNSFANGMDTPSTNTTAAPPYPAGNQEFIFLNMYPHEEQEAANPYATAVHRGHTRGDSNDFDPADIDIEEEHLLHPGQPAFGSQIETRNSGSRFTEEL